MTKISAVWAYTHRTPNATRFMVRRACFSVGAQRAAVFLGGADGAYVTSASPYCFAIFDIFSGGSAQENGVDESAGVPPFVPLA